MPLGGYQGNPPEAEDLWNLNIILDEGNIDVRDVRRRGRGDPRGGVAHVQSGPWVHSHSAVQPQSDH